MVWPQKLPFCERTRSDRWLKRFGLDKAKEVQIKPTGFIPLEQVLAIQSPGIETCGINPSCLFIEAGLIFSA